MLIMDGKSIIETFNRVLRHNGYKVCHLGAVGENTLNDFKNDKPDLVIMEFILRGKLDGVERARKIRQQWHVPIIFLAEGREKAILINAKDVGSSQVVDKLSGVDKIFEAIERLLEK